MSLTIFGFSGRFPLVGLILVGLLLALNCFSKSVWAAPEEIQILPCADPLGCIEFLANTTVLVGGLHDLSTLASLVGSEQSQASNLAVRDFGSLLGRPIEYRSFNTDCDSDTAVRLLGSQQAEPAFLGFVGPTCNDVAKELIFEASNMGTVLIAPSATRPAFTSPTTQPGSLWQPGFYTTSSNDLNQGIATAHFAIHNLGLRQLMIIGDGSQDSAHLSEVVSRAFRIQGGHILESRIMPDSDSALDDLVEHLSSSQPSAIYLPISHRHALRFLNKVRGQTSFQTFPILVSATWLESDVAQAVQGSNLTLYATGLKPRSHGIPSFMHNWLVNYGNEPRTLAGPQAYDAATILLQAARLVATTDYLGNISVGRLALRQAVAQLSGFPGVSGVLNCTETGYCGADDSWAVFQYTTGPGLGATWPPALVQHSLPPTPFNAIYLGRSLLTQTIHEGPHVEFSQVGTLQANEVLQVRQISPDGAWYNLQAGGWVPSGALDLYDLGMPVATFLPLLPVIEDQDQISDREVGHVEWPVPFRTTFEVADGLYVTLAEFLRDGDREYSNTVPTSHRVAATCPFCGHIGLRLSLENRKPGTDRTVSIHEFQLLLVRQEEGLPETIPAAELRCRLNRFRNDRVVLKPFVGETERDICFEVPDTTRVAWFYVLTYTPVATESSEETANSEFLHFSLQ